MAIYVVQISTAILIIVIAFISNGYVIPKWIETYQTLISALLALIAAGATVQYLSKQISQTERHNSDSRRRKFEAARTVLPLALSELCDYAGNSMEFALTARRAIAAGDRLEAAKPNLPSDVVATLESLVEHSEPDIAGAVRALVSEIQVHHARLRGLPSSPETHRPAGGVTLHYPEQLDTAIFDAAHLYGHATNFFEYARYKTDVPPSTPSDSEVMKLLVFFGLEETDFPNIFASLKRTD